MHVIVRKVLNRPLIAHYKRIFQIFNGFYAPSFFSDPKIIKSRYSQIVDYLYLFFILKILPTNYHLFGFDSKKRKVFKKYIGCTGTDPYYVRKFKKLWGADTILLHDKFIFKVICEHLGLRVPKHYGIYRIGPKNSQLSGLQNLMVENNLENLVLKPRFGAYGAGINFISRDELNNITEMGTWHLGEYIAEEHLRQHDELNKINAHSVNSIRIITIFCSDHTVKFLGAMLKTSSSSLFIDNFTMGGIAIGIDIDTGKLEKTGIVKQFISYTPDARNNLLKTESLKQLLADMKKNGIIQPGRILERHPVTQTIFHNFEIPYWDELKKMVIKAQELFYHIKSIGWDLVISPDGPVILEGNHLWGTIGIQAANGGLLTETNRKLFAQHGISFYI